MSNYPDNMNWPLYDATIGSTGGDEPEAKIAAFEPITVSECDECRHKLQLNDIGLCRACNEQAEAYSRQARLAYDNVKSTREAISNIYDLMLHELNETVAKKVGIL